jgi:hypothetical protein
VSSSASGFVSPYWSSILSDPAGLRELSGR